MDSKNADTVSPVFRFFVPLLVGLIFSPQAHAGKWCTGSHFNILPGHWREKLVNLDIRGFRTRGPHIHLALATEGNSRVRVFYEAATFLETVKFSRPRPPSTRDLQERLNRENRPYEIANQTLFWHSADAVLPVQIRRLMARQLPHGINCFTIALSLNGVLQQFEHIKIAQFRRALRRYFVVAKSEKIDLGVIFEGDRPIHAYIPLGKTGWVITKNGYDKQSLLRFMRETELIYFYREFNPEFAKTIQYFSLRK